MAMTMDKWIKKYLGKKTDWDGMYGVQCVDLADCFISEVLGLKIGFFGNAKFWWLNRNKSEWLKKNFKFVTPTYKNGQLQRGDIGIRTSGTYGHIFIIAGPAANGEFKYYDQNADGKGAAMTLRTKPYTEQYINGVLRPKNQKNVKVKKVKLPTFKKNKVYSTTTEIYVRSGPSTTYKIKKYGDLTTNAKQNVVSKQGDAILKKGTKFTVLDLKTVGNAEIWAKIPSGWIAVYYKGSQYAK